MDSKCITVTFSDHINANSIHLFIDKLEKLNEEKPEANKLTIQISSLGGDVDMAIELFNFIKALDFHVKMVNTSYVNSAAIIVFLAGDERVCLPSTSFYVHAITKQLNGIYSAGALIKEVREMNANTEKVSSLFEMRTKKNKSYWKRLMRKGQMITKEKALELGLTTK